MPILQQEIDLYPDDLLQRAKSEPEDEASWWALYTRSRREKELMRQLRCRDVAFYGPMVPHRTRAPSGRVRTSYVPLFPNYVFLYGDDSSRHSALTTNCISRTIEVADGKRLSRELQQICRLVQSGASLMVESRLEPGARVRVCSGSLEGQEGTVVNRRGQKRLVVSLDFLQQGASVLLEDFEVEPVN